MNARDDTLDFPLSKCDNLEANAVRLSFIFKNSQTSSDPFHVANTNQKMFGM